MIATRNSQEAALDEIFHGPVTPINFEQDYLAKVVNLDELNAMLRDGSREALALNGLGHQVVGHEV